jgi:HlyD family secretion protein
MPPSFAVRLRLQGDQLDLLGDVKLKPGMPAEVFIQTRARSPLSYLLQPLTDQIARSFRES